MNNTTHVFIVDVNTFKFHIEYLFAGTGAKDCYVDFNNSTDSKLHYATENNLLGLIADISRIRIGDKIIFYLQQNAQEEIYEGKFYGVFKVSERCFLDNNDDNQFLKSDLKKSLTFRIMIEPYQVYPDGITEWEALDEIKNIQSPNQMLWSLIYRKLKGNRGNTMITMYESERIVHLIRQKNSKKTLDCDSYTFNKNTQKIEQGVSICNYSGRKDPLIITNRLISKYEKGQQFETHLQAYILQNLEQLSFMNNENIEWIGNEVSCGVGMQRIDILVSTIAQENRKIIPIELKSVIAYKDIIYQIQRYIDWIEQYYIPNKHSDIEPMIISRKIDDKTTQCYKQLMDNFVSFNSDRNLKLRYIEFSVTNDGIDFEEIAY